MAWVRSGYCCRCGDCCQGDPYVGNDDARSELFKRAPEQPGRCPLLHLHVGNPEGDSSCLGHTGMVPDGSEDPYYLSGCNVWPSVPSHIENLPRCTYTFTWVDEE